MKTYKALKRVLAGSFNRLNSDVEAFCKVANHVMNPMWTQAEYMRGSMCGCSNDCQCRTVRQ